MVQHVGVRMPAQSAFGNAQEGAVRGPGRANFNFQMDENFRLPGERMFLKVGAEFDDALQPRLADIWRRPVTTPFTFEPIECEWQRGEAILARADWEQRIVVSADTDLGSILARQEMDHPSFFLFREPSFMVAADYADQLLPSLAALETRLAGGCVVVFRNGRIRARKLPFSA